MIRKLIPVLGAMLLAFAPAIAYAQTAAILPNARTQFIDANGQPVVGGTVGFYIPSTLTPKTTWQDLGETTPNANPVTLDSLGSALIWGSGSYREILKSPSGQVIWDGLTSSASSGSGGSGTVTDITAGFGLTGGMITTSGTIAVDTSAIPTLAASLNNFSGGAEFAKGFGANCTPNTAHVLNCYFQGSFGTPETTGGVGLLGFRYDAFNGTGQHYASATTLDYQVNSQPSTQQFLSPDGALNIIWADNTVNFCVEGSGCTTNWNIALDAGEFGQGYAWPNITGLGLTNDFLVGGAYAAQLGSGAGTGEGTLRWAAPITLDMLDSSYFGDTVAKGQIKNLAAAYVTPSPCDNFLSNHSMGATSANCYGLYFGTYYDMANQDGTTIVAPGGGSIAASPGQNITIKTTGGASTQLYGDGVLALQANSGGIVIPGVAILPATGTTNKGFNITQTGPSTGSVTGPLFYNEITTNSEANVTGGNQVAAALGVNFNVGGSNLGGQPMSAGYFNTQTQFSGFVSNADKIGLIGGAQANINDGSGSGYYGMNPVVSVTTGVSINRAVGFESDVIMNTGASANYRYAGALVNAGGGSGTGSTIDTALLIANIGGTAGAFKNGIDLSTNLGFVPIASSGSFLFADTSLTLANILNLPNVTVSGNILNFPNVTLSGAGAEVLTGGYVQLTNGAGATLSNGQGQIFASTNGGATLQGFGSNFDLTMFNKTGQSVCNVATGTRVWNCNTLQATISLELNGSGSGFLTVKAPAAAGSGTLTLPAGTTDFSATGGTGQVVQQTSSGSAFTVGQLATTNLSDVTAPTSWTPADASGATLTFSSVSATYTKTGKSLTALVSLAYPVTGSGAAASISGLPIGPPSSSVQNVIGTCWSSAGTTFGLMTAQVFSNGTSFTLFNSTGASVTNVNLTAATIRCAFNYVTN